MAAMNWENIKKDFFSESRDNLSSMEGSILALESGDDDPETINILFRAVHTIKGSSGMFDCPHIERFSHRAENLLQKLRSGSIQVTPALLDTLMASHDFIGELLSAYEESSSPEFGSDFNQREDELIRRIDLLSDNNVNPDDHVLTAEAEPSADDSEKIWNISISSGRDLFSLGLDPANFIAYLTVIGEIVSIETRIDIPADIEMDPEKCLLNFDITFKGAASIIELQDVFEFIAQDCVINITPGFISDEAPAANSLQAASSDKDQSSLEKNITPQKNSAAVIEKKDSRQRNIIRIDTEKIDELINHVGELVISNAGVVQLSKNGGRDGLDDSIENMSRLIENIRESAMNIRMVPISESFSRFSRMVRDLSRELGKEINFNIEGGETEIDKSIMDTIVDPLMHIIRNSIDHGLEAQEERLALGKPGKGNITLRAFQESGALILECEDDGRGLDREKITAKAGQQGLIFGDTGLSDNDINNLIFMPGFSTTDKVTSVSGRGVGMDVVRKNVELLRGGITIKSEKNYGTVFRIKLPLTLAIIDGFVVEVGDTKYIIPLYSVTECLDISPEEVHDDEGCSFIALRGEVLPFIRLNEIFGIEPDSEARLSIVVIDYAQGRTGLAVKKFIGENQTVVKPLGRIFSGHPWISGFTILGTGEIAPILDVSRLIPKSSEEISAKAVSLFSKSASGAGSADIINQMRH